MDGMEKAFCSCCTCSVCSGSTGESNGGDKFVSNGSCMGSECVNEDKSA